MPFCRTTFREGGVNFTNGYATTPLCGASRSTLLTGLSANEHGVWENGAPGGWQALSVWENQTVAVALRAGGYHTALVGKYMNGWSRYSAVTPPGWDDFMAISPVGGGDGSYYDYLLQGSQPSETYGSAPGDYSTDVITNKAVEFIAQAPSAQPLFLYYAPYGSHSPYYAAPRHEGTEQLPKSLNPAVNENVSDKSAWIRNLPPVDTTEMKRKIRDQREVVKSVDEGVETISKALAAANRTDTLWVYLGDNGLQMGEHRLKGKNVPYEGSAHLQMMARWDGHFTPGDCADLTRVADLVATMCVAAEIPLVGSGIPYQAVGGPEGIVLAGGPGDDNQPAWVSWRGNDNWKFVQWDGGEVELYNLQVDPNELTNVAAQNLSRVTTMRAKAVSAATPLPPTFDW